MDDRSRQDWREFRQGSRKAFDRLYVRLKDRLFSYCLYTSGDPELSRDVVQESFVKLLENQTDTEFESGLDNWMFVCVRNSLYNRLKRRRVRQQHEYSQALSESAALNNGEARVMLQQVLANLSVEERDLILMREFLGLTIPEISEAIAASEGAVRVRLHRIRKRIIELHGDAI